MSLEQIPEINGIDNTTALLREGYLFIKNRHEKYNTNIFKAHLMSHKVVCMTGKDAAEIFYDTNHFIRHGVAPKRVQKTLFGENAIQGMDGEAHSHRKALFISLTSQKNQTELVKIVANEWESSAAKWKRTSKINIFNTSKEVLCKSACLWSGVPLFESEVKNKAEDFASMVDAFGAIGLKHWKGRKARTNTEVWIGSIIKNVRDGNAKAPIDSPLYAMSFFKDINDNLLDINMAAIELINIIRPIVAISTYITFMALALHEHTNSINSLTHDKQREMFVQEVRRFYPFTPFVGAKVKNDFTWNNYNFKKNELVLLDIYGINHDSTIWEQPSIFNPERFKDFNSYIYEFIPQGGGDSTKSHRCPGEGITIELMKISLDFLANKIKYSVPAQDLSYDMSKIPTFPKSGFIINKIERLF